MNWFRPELRVLFVCTANICRSPLAEGLLRHRLRATALAGKVQVRSAGSNVGTRGRRPDPRVEKLAAEAGVSLARIRSRMLTMAMIRRSDYILVMERSHLEDIERLCAACDAADKAIADEVSTAKKLPDKVRLLGSFLPRQQDEDVQDIPDPYFGDWQGFCNVYALLDSALTGFLASVEMHSGNFRDS
jgi:protein-tyrosine phosphatase